MAQTYFSGGTGTKADPYLIGTVDDLRQLATEVNAGTYNDDHYFKLTADLDLKDVCNETAGSWIPIGTSTKTFVSQFNGSNHTISNLYINSESDNQGLFGYMDTYGVVSNLGLINCNVSANKYVGGVCGRNNFGTISTCYSTGSIKGSESVGGVCGANNHLVQYCYNTAEVSGNNQVAGVCGCNFNQVKYCYNIGRVTSKGRYVGAVSAFNSCSKPVTNCYYDKQMCTISDDKSEGKLTTEMTGSALSSSLGGNYTYTDGLYPRHTNTDAAIVSATPIFLVNEETVAAVATGFTVGTDNSVTWTSSNDNIISISDTNAMLRPKQGTVTLTASKNDVVYKTITVVKNSTATDAFTIDNVEDLIEFRDAVNAGSSGSYKGYDNEDGFANIHFELTADIDLSTVCNETDGSWIPIGNSTNRFNGIFNGGNHTISKLYIDDTSSDYQGLFGYFGKDDNIGSISNLGIINGSVNGKNYVGSVCGINNGTVTNCYNTGIVKGKTYVGGVCGRNNGTITYCYNTGNVTENVSGSSNVGGVCGFNYNTITNCHNTGNVYGIGYYVGGVCGQNQGVFNTCYNIGTVTGSAMHIGGVCGTNNFGTIASCYNIGTVNGSSERGGVCGTNDGSGKITNCYNSGNVTGNGTAIIGGVCGNNKAGSTINCYNSGNAAGVCGYNSGTITNCYYDKQRSSDGGIHGSDVAGQAEGKLAAEMTGTNIFSDADIWVTSNNMYPRLKNMETSNEAIVFATPIFLANSETVDEIISDFTVGTDNDVVWTSNNSNVVSIPVGGIKKLLIWRLKSCTYS